MAVRYRKSINLGGGVRVNLSRKGVGYSVGGKGVRVTKRAGGSVRTTVSTPRSRPSLAKSSKPRSQRPTGAVSGKQPKERYKWEPKTKGEERAGYIMFGLFALMVLIVCLTS